MCVLKSCRIDLFLASTYIIYYAANRYSLQGISIAAGSDLHVIEPNYFSVKSGVKETNEALFHLLRTKDADIREI